LQCVAVCCSVLQYAAVCCSVLQCAAVCCSVLQCTAVCCSVLQCAAVCCSVLQCAAVCCSVLQYVAVCCSVLQSLMRQVKALQTPPSLRERRNYQVHHSAPESSWIRVFDPCTPLLFDMYHYLEQSGYFWLVPEHAPGPISQVLPGCRVRHPCYSKKLFVRSTNKKEKT